MIEVAQKRTRGWLFAAAILFALGLHHAPAFAKCGQDFISYLTLAEAYETGAVVPQDLKKAAQYYLQAALGTDTYLKNPRLREAQYKIAIMYRDGIGIAQSDKEAYFWLSVLAAADEKYIAEMEQVVATLGKDKILSVDNRRVDFLSRKPTAICVVTGDVGESPKIAVPRLLPLAESGDIKSQVELSEYLNRLEYYKGGYFWSSLSLKDCKGLDCLKWAEMQREDAVAHLTPEELSEQDKKLKSWKPIHSAFKSDNPVPVAVQMHIRQAYKGDAAHQYILGQLYSGEIGHAYEVPRNMPEAYFWYAVAAKTEPANNVYSSHRDAVKASLTLDQLNLVEGRIRTWKAE